MRLAVRRVNLIRIVTCAHKGSVSKSGLVNCFVRGIDLRHISPTLPRKLPVGNIRVHRRFLFHLSRLRARWNCAYREHRKSAQTREDTPMPCVHSLSPVLIWSAMPQEWLTTASLLPPSHLPACELFTPSGISFAVHLALKRRIVAPP